MDIEELENYLSHSFLRNELIVYSKIADKKASKFQILSVSTETSRETTSHHEKTREELLLCNLCDYKNKNPI